MNSPRAKDNNNNSNGTAHDEQKNTGDKQRQTENARKGLDDGRRKKRAKLRFCGRVSRVLVVNAGIECTRLMGASI